MAASVWSESLYLFFLVMSTDKKPRKRNECNFSAPYRQFLARGIDSGYNPVGR